MAGIKKKDRGMGMITDWFVFPIVEHCNLNCHHCGSFAPLAREGWLKDCYMYIYDFVRDLTRLKELTQVNGIVIQGGEPLLHHDLLRFVVLAREICPDAKLQITTNGLLLSQQDEEFWEELYSNKCKLVITRYPIKLPETIINIVAEKYGVEIEWEPSEAYCKELEATGQVPIGTFAEKPYRLMYSQPIDITGSQAGRWETCYAKDHCAKEVRNGKLYQCAFAAHGHHLIHQVRRDEPPYDDNEIYESMIPVESCIDIHKVQSFNEIVEFMSNPVPHCAYCRVIEGTLQYPYKQSSKYRNEWTGEALY